MAAAKYGCPRCGSLRSFRCNSDNKLVIQVYDDAGKRVAEEPVANVGFAQPGPRVCANLQCGALYIRQHWEPVAPQDPHLDTLRRLLEELARRSGIISYRDLSFLYKRVTGFWVDHRLRWATALGALCDEDVSAGRYMLSALVVAENTGKPGPGFPWNRLGTQHDAQTAWNIWKKYVRQTHRHYFNAHFRPWLVKSRPHHAP